jgi:hypothetical protein
MGSRAGITAAAIGVIVASGLAPASALTPQVRAPRAGHYAGQVAAKPSPLPVTFTVANGPKRVTGFTAQALVKAGCTNHITSFEAPVAPMRISAAGRFARVSRAYPQKGVIVTVTGRFTSRTTATGLITIRLTRIKGCNATHRFSAQRTA